LQERIKRLEEQAGGNAQLRDALEKTLVSAQLHADETRANARKESELILRDAELKGRSIVADSYAETQRVQQALINSSVWKRFPFKFRSLLEGHLKLLDEAPMDLASPPAMAVDAAPSEVEVTPFVVPAAVEEITEYAPAPAPPRGRRPRRLLRAAPERLWKTLLPPRWALRWSPTCCRGRRAAFGTLGRASADDRTPRDLSGQTLAGVGHRGDGGVGRGLRRVRQGGSGTGGHRRRGSTHRRHGGGLAHRVLLGRKARRRGRRLPRF